MDARTFHDSLSDYTKIFLAIKHHQMVFYTYFVIKVIPEQLNSGTNGTVSQQRRRYENASDWTVITMLLIEWDSLVSVVGFEL